MGPGAFLGKGSGAFPVGRPSGIFNAVVCGIMDRCSPMSPVFALGFSAALLALAGAGCSGSASAEERDRVEVVVFAAASLTDAFREIAEDFEAANPGVEVVLNLGGSQRLRAQLEHGARADLFAPADREHAEAIVEAGLSRGEPVDFALNRLAVIASRTTAGSTDARSLGAPGTRVVLAHAGVPAGRYTREMLANLESEPGFPEGFAERVTANVVSEEPNVRRVAQKVALGDADMGVVYHTDAVAPDIAPSVRVAAVPDRANVAARYPVVLLRHGRAPETASRFVEYLLSGAGQGTLARHGFVPIPGTAVEMHGMQAAPGELSSPVSSPG